MVCKRAEQLNWLTRSSSSHSSSGSEDADVADQGRDERVSFRRSDGGGAMDDGDNEYEYGMGPHPGPSGLYCTGAIT
jgi:hypothetical protein